MEQPQAPLHLQAYDALYMIGRSQKAKLTPADVETWTEEEQKYVLKWAKTRRGGTPEEKAALEPLEIPAGRAEAKPQE